MEIFGHVFQVNYNGTADGNFTNGDQKGQLDVTLPNDAFYSFKFDSDLTDTNNRYNGNCNFDLHHRYNKHDSGRKFSTKITTVDCDFENKTYNINVMFGANYPNNKQIHADLTINRVTNDEDVTINYKVKNSSAF